jgi:hypothetical protein
LINPSFVQLNELIPEGDWEYFEDREMSMREAAGGIKFMKDVTETLDQRETIGTVITRMCQPHHSG